MKVFHLVSLGRLVTNERWRTSTSKLVDNAIGGFRCVARGPLPPQFHQLAALDLSILDGPPGGVESVP